jgi:hypothetical protein
MDLCCPRSGWQDLFAKQILQKASTNTPVGHMPPLAALAMGGKVPAAAAMGG